MSEEPDQASASAQGRPRDSAGDKVLGELSALVARAHKRGVRALTAVELAALPALYRFAATRLSRAQTAGANPRRTQKLAGLVAQAHALLYRDLSAAPGSLRTRIMQLLLRDCPRTIRAEWRMLALSCGAFYGLAALAYFLVSRDLELAFTFLNERALLVQLEQLRETAPGESFRGNFTFGFSVSANAAGAIIANNIFVAVLFFGSALLPPLFILLLGFNALMIGTYLGVAAHWDQALNISSILMCHGVLELQALALAGAAGLMLARGLYLPGVWSRSVALRREAARGWRLFAGILPMLIAAGLIEGYVSPHAGTPTRVIFMLVSALLLAMWVGLGGRGASAQPLRRSSSQAANSEPAD
jgi:uncharacterized membrane protein SpoIIM required for sporulation